MSCHECGEYDEDCNCTTAQQLIDEVEYTASEQADLNITKVCLDCKKQLNSSNSTDLKSNFCDNCYYGD